ncbi:MAG: acetyl-CoA carboxylase biotin carboxylase subunit [Geminicoccaceae bacterium]
MTRHLKRVLVANRGEIAVRIIRAARELGLETVQAHSTADADSLAVQLADTAVPIGPPPAAKSYLNIGALIDAARSTGCDAVHPGYGFLSENANFAEAVEAAGLTFVGPSPSTIRLMGDKAVARATAARLGIPTVPGSDGRVERFDEAVAALGGDAGAFPVLLKAAAGGGGRGIRIARDRAELERLWPQAAAEALAAFGDGGLYVEKLVERARHVEVQVLGDGATAVHLLERECSLQRRRQKVWEEAPAPAVPERVREEMRTAAARLAAAVAYRGAGTIEYLYDEAAETFYFLEMNTRVQVEHPVTEMVTGIDIVRATLEIAAGRPLRLRQEDVHARGHAIEVRINAEDPARDFAPCPGTVSGLRTPGGHGVRFDTLLFPGCKIPPFYDSLLGKLIVWDEDRDRALARLAAALRELQIDGVRTTVPLHRALATDTEVALGAFHTRWLERWLEDHDTGLGATP